MTNKKYVCCCHALDEDACKVLVCDSKSKLAFEATTQADTMVCGAPPPKNVERVISEYVDCKKGTIFFKLTTC